MNQYKFLNQEGTRVVKYPDTNIVKDGRGWNQYLDYVSEGGETDPFKTFDEWAAEALGLLWGHHDMLIDQHPEPFNPKASNKLTGALNRKVDGNPKPNDEKLLADNDRWNTAINRLYYASFYAVIALLIKNGIETQTHDGVRTQFGLQFVKTGIIDKKFGKLFLSIQNIK